MRVTEKYHHGITVNTILILYPPKMVLGTGWPTHSGFPRTFLAYKLKVLPIPIWFAWDWTSLKLEILHPRTPWSWKNWVVVHIHGLFWVPRQHFNNLCVRPSLQRRNSQYSVITSSSHGTWVSSHCHLLAIPLAWGYHANCLLNFPTRFIPPSLPHLGFLK